MNRRDVLIAKFSGDLAPASPRIQRAANSTTPRFLLIMIFIRMSVTFSNWHTYFVIKLTLNRESVRAARVFLEQPLKCKVLGEGTDDE